MQTCKYKFPNIFDYLKYFFEALRYNEILCTDNSNTIDLL